MKAIKLYVDRQYFSEQLGVSVDDFVIGDIKSNYNEIEFTLFINDSAIVSEATEIKGNELIRRKKLELIYE